MGVLTLCVLSMVIGRPLINHDTVGTGFPITSASKRKGWPSCRFNTPGQVIIGPASVGDQGRGPRQNTGGWPVGATLDRGTTDSYKKKIATLLEC